MSRSAEQDRPYPVDGRRPVPRPLEVRNAFTGKRELAFRTWITLVTLTGAVLLLLSLLQVSTLGLASAGTSFWLVCGLLLLTELRPLLGVGDRDGQGLLVSPAFVFAVLLGHGAVAALLLQGTATALVDVARRKALWRTGFNVAQYTVSWSAAGLTLSALQGSDALQAGGPVVASRLLPACAAALVYFGLNQVLVTVALALKSGTPVLQVFRDDWRHEALSNGALLGMAPVVALAMEQGAAFVPLLVPPLLAVYWVAKVAQERERQSLTDELSGLTNRAGLRVCVQRALASEQPAALLLLDLDRFKDVNDTLGHHVGDALLQVVARRLEDAVRPGDVVARLGGDEFAVLLHPLGEPGAAREIALRLHGVLGAPVLLEGLLVDVGASIGVAQTPEHGNDVDVLLQRADVAMYQAKGSGTGVCVYDASRDHHSTARLGMLADLRRALGAGELVLHYQPQAGLQDRRVAGVEALVRWEHPERGLVPPDEFIPLAEQSGLIQALTGWVLGTAVAQAAQWRAEGLDLTVAVNVSVRDLCGGTLPDLVAAALGRHELPADRLVLEVTEGMLFADPVRATATLDRLHVMGVALSLDDFGTGWSSLGHLRDLPVDEVKIDRSFVMRMMEDPRDEAIVRSVIDLATGLGMTVVAEGVEDEQVWQRLRALGCGTAQGWHLSRPRPAELLTPWLRERAGLELPLPLPRQEVPAAAVGAGLSGRNAPSR